MLLIMAACGGGSDAVEEHSGEPMSGEVQLVAKNLAFDKKNLMMAARSAVKVTLTNNDAGVAHGFAVYKGAEIVFRGELVAGVASVTYAFTTPAAGSYTFRCDVHPDVMTGVLLIH